MLSHEVTQVNPFDLPGPEFLVFYLILATAVIVGLVFLRRAAESDGAPKIDLSDPYLIAYLRGGESELLRVAIVTLIDRGLLIVNGTQIKRADNATTGSVRRAVEKALMEKFVTPGEATSVFNDPALKLACEPYQETLKRNLLLPDDSVTQARLTRFMLAFLVLGGVGGIKVLVALDRGRTNVFFLVFLTLFALVIAGKVSFPRLTARGNALLADVQTLYAGLKERASFIRPGGETIEPMMLAAAFGVGALAGDGFAYTKTLFPRAQSSAHTSSCGSSCGSSGGSSCGGGGCGGGCGGCGG